MKKRIVLVLLSAFLLCLVSCAGYGNVTDNTAEDTCVDTDLGIDVCPDWDEIIYRTPGGVLRLDTGVGAVYKRLAPGCNVYFAYDTPTTFYVTHDLEKLINEKFIAHNYYYEYDEESSTYTIYAFLASYKNDGGAYIITYDAKNDRCTTELKYRFDGARVSSDGSYYTYVSNGTDMAQLDYNGKSAFGVFDKRFEPIIKPGTLDKGVYYPIVGRLDVTAESGDEITYKTALGGVYTAGINTDSPFIKLPAPEYGAIDLYTDSKCTLEELLQRPVGKAVLKFNDANESNLPQKGQDEVFIKCTPDDRGFSMLMDSDGDTLYFGCMYNDRLIAHPTYTAVDFGEYGDGNKTRYAVFTSPDDALIVIYDTDGIKLCGFSEGLDGGDILYVKDSSGKWGGIKKDGMTVVYDFIYDSVSLYDTCPVFTVSKGEATHYLIGNIDEEYSSVYMIGDYKLYAVTTEGEGCYITLDGDKITYNEKELEG